MIKKDMRQTNALRFIDAYNRLDKAIRDVYNIKPALSFSDAVRRASSVSSVIRKFEDDLIDFGRLRNCIVHRTGDIPIAEPHDDVVQKLESIARLVSTPPLAITCLNNRAIVSVDANDTLATVFVEMFKTGFSCIPVYSSGTLVGVVNRKMLNDAIGSAIINKIKLETLLKQTVVDSLKVLDVSDHYEVVDQNISIDNLMYIYQQNQKLSVIILTKGGSFKEFPVAIVVPSDLITMQEILDNY